MRDWREALFLAPAWLAIALLLFVTVSISAGSLSPRVQRLTGDWVGKIEAGDRSWSKVVAYPGLLQRQGVPSSSLVRSARGVQVDGPEPMALWVDAPCCALIANWDGEEVGRSGNPMAFGAHDRRLGSLLAIVPPTEPGSEHTIELVLRGDFGKGGITGNILFGPADDVFRAASAQETQRLALALGLSLLAFLPLTVAAGRRSRSPYLFYGLFASCLALQSYAQSNAGSDLIGTAEAALRLQRVAGGALAPLMIGFLFAYVYGDIDRYVKAFLAIGVTLALAGLVTPAGWLYGLEIVQDITLALGIPWFVYLLFQGVRRKVPGAWLLVGLTLLPVMFGVIWEIILTHGMRTGQSQLFEASLLMVGGTGAALMLKDALVSARHEQLISSSVDAMVVVGESGLISDANPSAEAVLGPCIDRNLLEYVEAEDHPVVRAHIQRGRKGGDRVEFRLSPEIEGVVESLATPLDPDITLLVLRDVTQRKHIDRSLIHAARLETVGLLLGGIAHDFNNMLGTLLAHVGWLQVRIDDAPAQDRMERMESTIDRASQLTRRLLTIARGSSAELGAIDLAAVCRNAVELVEPTLGSNIGLELQLPPQLPPVHGDAAELEQVLVNLLVNARDAMDDGGRVRLAVRAFQLQDGARGVCAMVEDNGPGVPDEVRSEIFQPFITTKGRGTGLGLAVASQVARDHHGRIWHEERPGGGARFLLALRHADAVDQAPAPLPEGRSVLLVEDERVLLEDYSTALRNAGYDVTAMGDPAQAASWMLGRKPDILVTDVVMDGLSGLELATLCSHRYPDVPVLLVSGFIPDDNLAYSTWHRLHKPLRAARLVSTVGHLRRRAERAERGEMDITRVTYLFPTLQELTAERVGFT